ncbi:MAG TPA: DUF4190 domain-containing protein [Microlunatus sp.]|nr:DUF4190 domain-containing protein [Microlunatus sp.]
MTETPNPFSREGAAGRSPQQHEPPGPAAEAWPTYPPAPAQPYEGGGHTAPPVYPASYPGAGYPAAGPYGAGTSPYGAPGYGSGAYAAGVYGYTPSMHPQSVAALVLGVVGLVICSYVGIAAFLVGRSARKEILAQPDRYSGLGMATAGWVMGIIGIVLSLLVTLFLVIGMTGGFDS